MAKSRRRTISSDEQHVLDHLRVRLVSSPKDKAQCDQLIVQHHYLKDATLRRDLPEFRRAQALGYPVAGMVGLIVKSLSLRTCGDAPSSKPRDMQQKKTTILAMSLMLTLLTGCVGVPRGVKPVENFSLGRYLGRWYEIARLDHSFEKGLSCVTADYSMRDDGGVRVLNRGYSEKKQEWKAAEGKAFFVKSPDEGHLKVSFFGPFYGSYVIFELDEEDYQYSVVCGPNRSYLWILARKPEIEPELKHKLSSRAAALGFDTANLIFADQVHLHHSP